MRQRSCSNNDIEVFDIEVRTPMTPSTTAALRSISKVMDCVRHSTMERVTYRPTVQINAAADVACVGIDTVAFKRRD